MGFGKVTDVLGKGLNILGKLNGLLNCKDSAVFTGLEVGYFKGLYVPNSFAPNTNSGEAALFLPKGKSLKEYRLQIFDKFGNLLWISEEIDFNGKPQQGWDGNNLNGIAMPQGTYIWKIDAIFSDDTVWEGMQYKDSNQKVKQGALYLIR